MLIQANNTTHHHTNDWETKSWSKQTMWWVNVLTAALWGTGGLSSRRCPPEQQYSHALSWRARTEGTLYMLPACVLLMRCNLPFHLLKWCPVNWQQNGFGFLLQPVFRICVSLCTRVCSRLSKTNLGKCTLHIKDKKPFVCNGERGDS